MGAEAEKGAELADAAEVAEVLTQELERLQGALAQREAELLTWQAEAAAAQQNARAAAAVAGDAAVLTQQVASELISSFLAEIGLCTSLYDCGC